MNFFKFNKNILNLFYEIWKQFVKNKFIVNANYFVDEYIKTITFINWIENKARKHVFVKRNVDITFFKTFQMIFDALFLIYAKKNKKRNIRNKFKTFIIRINQRFSKKFSIFLLLINQLFQYSKQNLTNKFREKFTFQFQRIIVNNDKFNRIQSLKKSIEKINQKLHFLKSFVSRILRLKISHELFSKHLSLKS